MSKVLDLGALVNKDTLDIAIPNEDIYKNIKGLTLHIRKPTFKDYATLISMQQLLEEDKSMDTVMNFIIFILNCNADGITVTKEDIEAFDNSMMEGLILAYSEHVGAIASNPTTTRRQSPQAKKAK